MESSEFVSEFRAAFGAIPSLPMAFYYSDKPVAETVKRGGCIFKFFPKVFLGNTVSLNAETIGCGGGKFYTGFVDLPDCIPDFVSVKEKYKDSPEKVCRFINQIGVEKAHGKYLNFQRVDRMGHLDNIEGLIFFATPDVLSGLCSWAFFDRDEPDTVSTLFGSGCSSIISTIVNENRKNGYRCFLGLFDPSVRPWVDEDVLSFAIPKCRLDVMMRTLPHTCLSGTSAWNKVRKRINGVM
ncbi:MAG: DUF169 domain-containing protein [Prevotella sp.]|nr:DUF169 domain-containing protein [Prevotella sp.]MCH3992985.1 DUF169 domain-containing protein [Prevotella sp.]MCH4018084.1 DUF169 domain-containing protein [Prevotella sp.]MCH4216930.1 DUF169 domain-containing protein [Prevotella sp.]MCI1290910.1 DUF169 domain-containing protein [Prevotella sp.]